MQQSYRLGIDIGGTNTFFGLVGNDGKILYSGAIKTEAYQQIEDYIKALHQEIKNHIPENYFKAIEQIGIGAPNGNYYTGQIAFAPNLPWTGVIALAAMIEQEFKIATKITNDANAAALGELMYGAAKGMKDFIMVTLGTGVGSGFVSNGQVIYGHDGFAGELGHVIIEREGRLCGCGRKGCLETYASATGIVITAHEQLAHTQMPSVLRDIKKIESSNIYDAALQQDALAIQIFNYTGQKLGEALANAVAITSPEAIILFGGLAKAGKFITDPTLHHMEQNLLSIYKNKVKLMLSALPDNEAAILGAAAII